MSPRGFHARFWPWILLAFAVLGPFLVLGSAAAIENVANDVRDWLPASFEETKQYQRFLAEFGTEEMVVVSWPGATLDDPRLIALAERLEAEGVASDDDGSEEHLFRAVYAGPRLLDELTSAPLKLPREVALERLRGSLVAQDGDLSAVVAVLAPAGSSRRHEVVELLRERAEDVGVAAEDLRLGGPTIDSVALDVESERSRNLLSLIGVLVGFLFAWFCLRRVHFVAVVLVAALLSTALAVTALHYFGGKLDLVMIMMPPLVYVLTISGAIHIVNYYVDSLAQPDCVDPVARAVRIGLVPTTLTATTTAIGLASLAISAVAPVRSFGVFSAVGVLLSLPVLLLFVPAALQAWPVKRSGDVPLLEEFGERKAHWTRGPVSAIARFHRVTLVASVLLIAVIGSGLARLHTSVRLLNLFSPETRIVQDYRWFEESFGPLVPVEVVLHVDGDRDAKQVERLELVRLVHDRLNDMPEVGGTLSAATFGPENTRASSVIARRILDRKLERSRERFTNAGYLRPAEGGGEAWRVSARVEALGDIDYGRFVDEVHAELDPLVDAWSEAEGADVELVVTGVVPLVYKAQRALLNDLVSSFGMAFLLIGVLMMILLGSIRAGLLSMLPNVFPAIIAFGTLGWWGRPVGIGEVMTASLALGIAVDDTVHLLSWFRRGVKQGLSRMEALHGAFEHCTVAMLQTSLVTGGGVLVFAFSRFVPTASFAWLLFVLLFLALAGELILVPAILAGRWGRYFERRAPQPVRDATPEAESAQPSPG